MLEPQYIISNRDFVIKCLNDRKFKDAEHAIDGVIELYTSRKNIQIELDNINNEVNQISSTVEGLIKSGDHNIVDLKDKSAGLKKRAQAVKSEFNNVSLLLNAKLAQIPNILHSLVPIGDSANDNVVIFEKRHKEVDITNPLPHWELISKYDIIDFELGVKLTGAGFPVFKNKGARLQRGLINYLLDRATKNGYIEILPPLVVNEASAFATGQLPDMEGQMYHVQNDRFYLISTAEIPVTNMLREKIISSKELPLKFVSYTPCFRREAGSWGANVRGLNRLHQFDKVELVQITSQNDSYEIIKNMLEFLKSVLDELQITYRILNLCSGDISSKASLQYDFEAWSGAQNKWLEISTLSNFETYQSSRMNTKYKENNKTNLVHTLNGSCFGLPRLLAAILENYQTDSGIEIPHVLRPFVGFDYI